MLFRSIKHSIIEESTIGNFVEVKNSEIKKQVKAKHLSYIGNALIEDGVNIGWLFLFKERYKFHLLEHPYNVVRFNRWV